LALARSTSCETTGLGAHGSSIEMLLRMLEIEGSASYPKRTAAENERFFSVRPHLVLPGHNLADEPTDEPTDEQDLTP
ncbi:MAG: hypothetical protein ACR2PK_15200, partial [Acidimicrobiales bacterium]